MRSTIHAVFLTVLAAFPAAADVLEDIAERGTIRLGVRDAAAPFSYTDETGAPSGLAVTLCHRVVASIKTQLDLDKLEIEYVIVDPLTRFVALENGETDLNCGPTTATLARRTEVDFSIPYFMDGIGAALRRDGVQDIEDLKGQPIGALAGTTSVPFAQSIGQEAGSPLIEFADYKAGLTALAEGRVDVFFGDQGLLLYQVGELKQADRLTPIKVIDDQYSFEPYALAMRAGEHKLRIEVDRALSAIYRSQEIFDDIEAALGAFEMSELTALIYALMALPE